MTALRLIFSPWTGWIAAGLLAFLWFKHPRIVTTVKTEIVTKTVTLVKWKSNVEALPGAKTTISPGGEIHIEGPAKLVSEGQKDEHTNKDERTSTTTSPEPRRVSLGAAYLFPSRTLHGDLSYGIGSLFGIQVSLGASFSLPYGTFDIRQATAGPEFRVSF